MDAFFSLSVSRFLESKIFLVRNGEWLGMMLLLVVAAIIARILKVFIRRALLNLCTRYKIKHLNRFDQKFYIWSMLLIISVIWIMGLDLFQFQQKTFALFSKSGRMMIGLSAIMAFNYLIDLVFLYFEKLAEDSDSKFDDVLVPLIKKAIKFVLFCIGLIILGDLLNLDMKGILAGLGIGGIAFALAAQDTIANLFGSVTVLADQPFQIGDWVKVGGTDVEGTVETVGLRSTRIRTFNDSLVTLPNGQLTKVHIDNFGKRKFRRFHTNIGVEYNTPPEKIEAFCEGIRHIILSYQSTKKDDFHVYLHNFGPSSLDIRLIVFWDTDSWAQELSERHRLLIDILRLGKELKISFAFPTTTVHLFSEQSPCSDNEIKQREEIRQIETLGVLNHGKNVAQSVIAKSISPLTHRSGDHILK